MPRGPQILTPITPRVALLNQYCRCGHAGWLHTAEHGCLALVANGGKRTHVLTCVCKVTADEHVAALS